MPPVQTKPKEKSSGPTIGPDGVAVPGPLDTPEGRKADIEQKFEKAERKNAGIKEKMALSRQDIRKLKMEILGQVFESLQQLGVDPNDLGSIRRFMDMLEKEDPDLAFLFSDAFKGLDPDAGMTPEDSVEAPDGALPGEGLEKFDGLRETMGGPPPGMGGPPPGMGGPPPGMATAGPTPDLSAAPGLGAPPPGLPTGPPKLPPGL